jgi:hypothetical protein
MVLFLSGHYQMWQRRRRFRNMNPDQKKKRIKELWQLLKYKTKTSMFLKSRIEDQAER